MARVMSRSKPGIEGYTGLKFSEILVIGMAIALIVVGVRWYLDYRRSASAALQEFIGAIKAGNVGNQYGLLDDQDKHSYFPTRADYEKNNTLAHGYTERIENATLGREEKDEKNPDNVTIPISVSVRATAEGKQLYQTGQSQTFSDKIVMHKGSDGKWRVRLSASIVKSTGKLHLQEATPSPQSMF